MKTRLNPNPAAMNCRPEATTPDPLAEQRKRWTTALAVRYAAEGLTPEAAVQRAAADFNDLVREIQAGTLDALQSGRPRP